MKVYAAISFAALAAAGKTNPSNGGSAMSSGGPGNQAAANNPPAPGAQLVGMPANLTPSQKTQLQAASIQWSKDTSTVSCALNMGLKAVQQPGSVSNQDFVDIMDAAYDAEVDETIQKATIDALLGDMPVLQSASANLTNGTFISVVDGLREMSIRGLANMTTVKAVVDLMNTNRCRPIMQAIDAYVQTAAAAVGNTTFVSAVRPQYCLNATAQTGQPITAAVVNNCTVAPRANELSRDYGQSPTFQLSRVAALAQSPGTDQTGQLGDSFPNGANMSSALGQQPGLFPNGQFPVNGNPSNTIANPVNADFGLPANSAGNGTNNAQSTPPPANGPSGTGTPLNAAGQPNVATNGTAAQGQGQQAGATAQQGQGQQAGATAQQGQGQQAGAAQAQGQAGQQQQGGLAAALAGAGKKGKKAAAAKAAAAFPFRG